MGAYTFLNNVYSYNVAIALEITLVQPENPIYLQHYEGAVCFHVCMSF